MLFAETVFHSVAYGNKGDNKIEGQVQFNAFRSLMTIKDGSCRVPIY